MTPALDVVTRARAGTRGLGWRGRAPLALAAGVCGLHIAYPLATGPARDRLAVASVLVFFLASVSHAWLSRGPRFVAALLAVTAGGGLAVELAGVRLGLPFGAYAYSSRLGPGLAGVPLVIPLAWAMMAYPAFLVARRVSARRLAGPALAGLALASWDLFLDPQMVAAGLWTWLGGGPALLAIPLSNFAGWLVTGTLMAALLWPRLGEPARGTDRVPYGLYLWVYASSVLGHAAFLDLPRSALAGGVVMGTVVVAFCVAVARR